MLLMPRLWNSVLYINCTLFLDCSLILISSSSASTLLLWKIWAHIAFYNSQLLTLSLNCDDRWCVSGVSFKLALNIPNLTSLRRCLCLYPIIKLMLKPMVKIKSCGLLESTHSDSCSQIPSNTENRGVLLLKVRQHPTLISFPSTSQILRYCS